MHRSLLSHKRHATGPKSGFDDGSVNKKGITALAEKIMSGNGVPWAIGVLLILTVLTLFSELIKVCGWVK